MDAMLIKHLSRLCRKQAEEMSANIAQFRHKEYLERLGASMRGGGAQPIVFVCNLKLRNVIQADRTNKLIILRISANLWSV